MGQLEVQSTALAAAQPLSAADFSMLWHAGKRTRACAGSPLTVCSNSRKPGGGANEGGEAGRSEDGKG